MKERYQRPVSLVERGWVCIDELYPPYCNQVVLEGSGDPDFEKLKGAVDKASEANPGSRLVMKGVLNKCYWLDSGVSPEVKLINDCDWDGRSDSNAPFLKVKLPYSGPTCEVVYAKGDISRLIFRSNHAVMDGMGTFTWMDDIFRALRGEEPLGSMSTLSEKDLADSLLNKTNKPLPANGIAPTGKAAKFEKGVTWKRLTFSGPQSLLIGKVAQALAKSARQYGNGAFRVSVPVDIRFRKPGLRCTGNLSNALIVEIAPESTPETITHDIKNQLADKKDLFMPEITGGNNLKLIPLWLMKTVVNTFNRLFYKNMQYQYAAVISNLGVVDTQKYSGGGFTTENVFLIPPIPEIMPAFVVLTGSSGKIDVTVALPNLFAGDGRLERLLDGISEALT